MTDQPHILVVGELNPYGVDPDFALYHLPRQASGDRLRQIMGCAVDEDWSIAGVPCVPDLTKQQGATLT